MTEAIKVFQIESFLDWMEEHTSVELIEEEWDYDYGGTYNKADRDTLIRLYREHMAEQEEQQ